MVTRRLGAAGPELTPLGIGTWGMSGRYQYGWGPVDDEESVAAIRTAVGRGVNWVDSAALYGLGHAEAIVGRALEPFRPGEDVYVFTKCGRRWERGADGVRIRYDLLPESIRAECEDSLSRLGVERIDLYQFHWPDYGTETPVEESWATMAGLADEGKVRWCGVSNFTVDLLERCESIRHVDSLQPRLSLLDRHALGELIPWCRAHGTGVIVYSPLGSGVLSGRFDLALLADDDWRRRAPQFQEPQLGRNLALVDRLRPLAERRGIPFAALAVAWTLSVPGVTGAIVGGRRPSQVEEWLPAASLELGPDELAEIEAALAETGAEIGPPVPPPQ
jgi:aryl-alcohol dehydrogenase-like predicted oxidoreductase